MKAIANLRCQIANCKAVDSRSGVRPLSDGRRGMTLVELLVVVTIIMVVAAATIPRLRPEIDRTRTREAARSVQLYLSSARNLAITTGRPCGVMIERLGVTFDVSKGTASVVEPGCSMLLSQVETPPPYCGEATGSVLRVEPHVFPNSPPVGMLYPYYAVCDLTFDNTGPSIPIYPNDLIQVGYQGPWYTVCPDSMWDQYHKTQVHCNDLNPNGSVSFVAPGFAPIGTVPPSGAKSTVLAYLDVTHGEQSPFLVYPTLLSPGNQIDLGYPPAAMRSYVGPYKIMRQPTKSAASALQFPSPACIDLTFSGPDTVGSGAAATFWGGSSSTDASPVIIMFASDGSIDRVYVNNQVTHPITPICLLIGKRENVNNTNPQNWNLQDFNNLWVAINPRTGLIITTDLAATGDKSAVDASRLFVRQSDAMGGK